jgi:hypothetical protein
MPCVHYYNRPIVLQRSEVIGVFVGGCIIGEFVDSHLAHAHTDLENPAQGWICFKDEIYLNHVNICLHELAHILTNQGHTDVWRKKLLEIGGTLDGDVHIQHYYKKPRKKKT